MNPPYVSRRAAPSRGSPKARTVASHNADSTMLAQTSIAHTSNAGK